MKQALYILEYILLIGVTFFLRMLPRRVALFTAARLGDLSYYCIPFRRKLVIDNLARAFPEKPPHKIARIARAVYRNFGKTAVEHLRLPGMDKTDLLEIVRIEGEEHLQEAFGRKQGIILAGGHFGNWEYMIAALAAAGYPVNVVAADMNNPYVNRLIRSNRIKMGVNLLPKKGSLEKIVQILTDNGLIILLMDQDARKRGVFVDFFGRPASTPKGPAKLALSYGAALLFAIPQRNNDQSITIKIEKIEVNGFDKTDANAVPVLTQHCSQTLEKYVRNVPEQWFWFHRRWKTRPPKETASLTGRK